ncbi:MAG: oxidative stress defense protein [Plesiomonas sp.]|uniref:oxidative stress defense protein n=1 Tax=Plesiomonas sp. TaxID=2486279 RepID=UPI003F3BE56F
MNLKVLTIAIMLAVAPGVSMASTMQPTTQTADVATALAPAPTLATTGNGSVDAVSNMATLSIEVNQSAKTAADAKTQVDTRVSDYMAFLEKNGVAVKDINAANLITQPEYQYVQDKAPTLIGYRAIRHVDVKVMDLSKLNDLLNGALKAGLNDIQGIQMGVSDPQSYQLKAREAAIKDAISKANSIAHGFGVKIGQVEKIRYDTTAQQQPMPPMLRMAAYTDAASAKVNQTYQQPTLHFTDHVDVVFSLSK